MCGAAFAIGVNAEELPEEADDFPEEAYKACLMTKVIAGGSIGLCGLSLVALCADTIDKAMRKLCVGDISFVSLTAAKVTACSLCAVL